MWEKIKWLLKIALKFKTSYPKTGWGVRCCIASLMSGILSFDVFDLKFESGYIVDTFSFADKEPSFLYMALSVALFILGIVLIYSEWEKKLSHISKVIISAMPGVPIDFPNNILEPSEVALSREPVKLGVDQSIHENIQQQVKMYNAELEADVFKRFILQGDVTKLYIGGLGRIPFLVSYGAMLKNQSVNIVYFDKFHRDGQYRLLDDVNENIEIKTFSLNNKVNLNGDIGLALGFSTPIIIEQLPESIQNFTTILEPNSHVERNLIKNQVNLQNISRKISTIIDELSSIKGCRKIHLFLSVQSTLALEIGRHYQEGTHKNWVIHNFDAKSNTYNWALELSNQGVEYI